MASANARGTLQSDGVTVAPEATFDTRHVAEACTSARELTWYVLRLVQQLRRAWFGEEGSEGIRETNAHWLRGLEERQGSFARTSARTT